MAEEIAWEDIRWRVKAVNNPLFNLIEKIKPLTHHKLIRVRYAYGVKIVDNGVIKFPTIDKRHAPLSDPQIPEVFKRHLNYCEIPLALVLNNASEVLIEQPNRIIPLNYFQPGDLFGVFETVDFLRKKLSNQKWTVTAGARSFFMLPKATDIGGYSRLKKKYQLRSDMSSDLIHQWPLYGDLAQNNGGIANWHNEVVFFTNEWFVKDRNDAHIAWVKFYNHIFSYCLTQLDYLRLHTELDLLWEPFTVAISDRGLKPRPYLMNTVKQLISIASGISVGFRPAIDNSAAPVDMFTDIFINDYELKDYYPLFMHPYKLKSHDPNAVYYSLSLPTVLEASPYTKNPVNIIDDQRDIHRLLHTIKAITSNGDVQVYSKIIATTLQRTKFEYFHCSPDVSSEIRDSKEIPLSDKDFDPRNRAVYHDRKFCANSRFMKGCIKIAVN